MSSADLIETLIKCQNTTNFSARKHTHTHTHTLTHTHTHTHTHSQSTCVFNLFDSFGFCFSCPLSNFLPLFSLCHYRQNTQTFTVMHGKKKILFCYSFTCSRSCTPTHTGFPLISFFSVGQRLREGKIEL